jgi:hypothetical protein
LKKETFSEEKSFRILKVTSKKNKDLKNFIFVRKSIVRREEDFICYLDSKEYNINHICFRLDDNCFGSLTVWKKSGGTFFSLVSFFKTVMESNRSEKLRSRECIRYLDSWSRFQQHFT